jgi:hypothetical protein
VQALFRGSFAQGRIGSVLASVFMATLLLDARTEPVAALSLVVTLLGIS